MHTNVKQKKICLSNFFGINNLFDFRVTAAYMMFALLLCIKIVFIRLQNLGKVNNIDISCTDSVIEFRFA